MEKHSNRKAWEGMYFVLGHIKETATSLLGRKLINSVTKQAHLGGGDARFEKALSGWCSPKELLHKKIFKI